MGIISEGLRHSERCHAALMSGVTNVERAALLRPLSEDDQAKKMEIIRTMIAGRRVAMGTGTSDEPGGRDDGYIAFCWFLAGVISTTVLVLGAWVRLG